MFRIHIQYLTGCRQYHIDCSRGPDETKQKTTKKDTNTDRDQTTRRDAKQHERNVDVQKGLKPKLGVSHSSKVFLKIKNNECCESPYYG